MSEANISNPHDHFFRATFSQLHVARDFIGKFLPEEVLSCLDLATLDITKDSFVDAQLRSSCADLLYEVSLQGGGHGLVYLLFEHKSSPDPMVSFQLLRYMVRIWEQRWRQDEDLCPIVPLILYHGRTRWSSARTIQELVVCPDALRGYLPNFATELYDLSKYSDDELKGQVLLHASLLLLKYIHHDQLPKRLPEILGLFARLSGESGMECLRTALIYLTSGSNCVDSNYLTEVIHEALEHEGERLMPTIAEQWIQEGIAKGREEGIAKGRQEGIAKGHLRGREEGLRSGIRAMLEFRFPKHHVQLTERVEAIGSAKLLTQLLELGKTAPSFLEIQAFLDDQS